MNLRKANVDDWLERHGQLPRQPENAPNGEGLPTAYIDGVFCDPEQDMLMGRVVERDTGDKDESTDYALFNELYTTRNGEWYVLSYAVHDYRYIDEEMWVALIGLAGLLYCGGLAGLLALLPTIGLYPSVATTLFFTGLLSASTFGPRQLYTLGIDGGQEGPDPHIKTANKLEALKRFNGSIPDYVFDDDNRVGNRNGHALYEIDGLYIHQGPDNSCQVFESRRALQEGLQGAEQGRLVRQALE